MTDIEKKAREYALSGSILYEHFYTERARLGIVKFSGRDLEAAFLAGAAYALGNQWRDAEKEKPTHNHLVLAEVEVDTPEICFCTAYYQDGIWVMPDDFYYDCKVLRWLEIPEYEPKGGDK